MTSRFSGVFPAAGTMSVTEGFPFVRVPVLSRTMVVSFSDFSRYSPPLMRSPFSAPFPVPTMIAVGVAIPKAQGHAIMMTATKMNREAVIGV